MNEGRDIIHGSWMEATISYALAGFKKDRQNSPSPPAPSQVVLRTIRLQKPVVVAAERKGGRGEEGERREEGGERREERRGEKKRREKRREERGHGRERKGRGERKEPRSEEAARYCAAVISDHPELNFAARAMAELQKSSQTKCPCARRRKGSLVSIPL